MGAAVKADKPKEGAGGAVEKKDRNGHSCHGLRHSFMRVSEDPSSWYIYYMCNIIRFMYGIFTYIWLIFCRTYT